MRPSRLQVSQQARLDVVRPDEDGAALVVRARDGDALDRFDEVADGGAVVCLAGGGEVLFVEGLEFGDGVVGIVGEGAVFQGGVSKSQVRRQITSSGEQSSSYPGGGPLSEPGNTP